MANPPRWASRIEQRQLQNGCEQKDEVEAKHPRLKEHSRTAIAHQDMYDNSAVLPQIQRNQVRNLHAFHRALKQLQDLRRDVQNKNGQTNLVPNSDTVSPSSRCIHSRKGWRRSPSAENRQGTSQRLASTKSLPSFNGRFHSRRDGPLVQVASEQARLSAQDGCSALGRD
jgi:hypothetical protein